MPSPQADRLTREHRTALHAVVAEIVRAIRALAGRANQADIDAWWRANERELTALVAGGWGTSARLAERYLAEHARVSGRAVVPVRATWSSERVATSLRVTGPVAFKKSVALYGSPAKAAATMRNTLPAAATRLVLAGERETVEATVRESDVIVGWRRVTDEDPCAWCAMLAGRGAVYNEDSAVKVVGRRGVARGAQVLGASYHDGCECTAKPLYEGEEESEDVQQLQEDWERVTAGLSGKAALREWRRWWDERKGGA